MFIRTQNSNPPRRGAVLLAVVVVVVIMALAAYQYSDLAFAEMKAADNSHRMAQSKAAAESGIHLMASLLRSPDALADFGGNPFNNDGLQLVSMTPEESRNGPVFQVIAPPETPDQGFRFGATDESSKINLNMLLVQDATGIDGYDILMKLPNMTAEIANSILDWMDPDSDQREEGAESDYYSLRGYQAKNGPFESIEELLFVKGVTEQTLYGDPEKGIIGLTAYVTIYSREQRVTADGLPFIKLNQDDPGLLYDELLSISVDDNVAKFVALYRRYGPSNSSGKPLSFAGSIRSLLAPEPPADDKNTEAGDLADITDEEFRGKSAKREIKSLFELVDAQVSISSGSGKNKKTKIYSSPFYDQGMLRQELPKLFTSTAVDDETEIPARVNVNTCTLEVLAALPGMKDDAVDLIAGVRPNYSATEPPDPIFDTPAWLISEANLNPQILRNMEPYITTRTQVFRVQVMGHYQTETGPQGPVVHLEAVIDTNGGRPRTIFWRNISELGHGRALLSEK